MNAGDPVMLPLAVVAYIIAVRVPILCIVPSPTPRSLLPSSSTLLSAKLDSPTMTGLDAGAVGSTPASAQELAALFRHQSPVNMTRVIRTLYDLRKHTPSNMLPLRTVRLGNDAETQHASMWPGETLGSRVFGPGGVSVTAGDPPVASVGVAAASLLPGPGPSYALPVGDYPPFLRFPKFVVDFQLKERQRIVAEEAALQSKRRLAEELSRRK